MAVIRALACLALFMAAAPFFGAEKYAQKVGLSINTAGPNYSYESVIWKSVLDRSAGLKDIVIVSGSVDELEMLGLKELSAWLFLAVSPSTNTAQSNFTVCIYAIEKTGGATATNLISGNLSFTPGGFVSSLEQLSAAIIDAVKARYPMKEKTQIETIVIEKKGISEFEKENPSFAFSLIAAAQMDRADIGINEQDSNQPRGNNGFVDDNDYRIGLAVSPEALFQWRWFSARLGGSFDLSFLTYQAYADLSFGILGSLLTFGPSAFYYSMSMASAKNLIRYEGTNLVFQTPLPDVRLWCACVGLNVLFNISRDYSIQLRFLPAAVAYGVYLDFKNPMFPSRWFPEWPNGSPPYFDLAFSFRIYERHWLVVRYSSLSFYGWMDFNSTNPANQPVPIGGSGGTNYYLGSSTISRNYLGIGYQYEL